VDGCIDALTPPCATSPCTWFGGGGSGSGGVRVAVVGDGWWWFCEKDKDDNDLGWAVGGGVRIDESFERMVALGSTVSGGNRE
jgi:opacity protein-like surface antigen